MALPTVDSVLPRQSKQFTDEAISETSWQLFEVPHLFPDKLKFVSG